MPLSSQLPQLPSFPTLSPELLWEWDIPTDTIFLSEGSRRALEFEPEHLPESMTQFLSHIPPACIPTLHELREGVLSGTSGSFLETTYPFNSLLVRERLFIIDRNQEGRAIHAMGMYAVSPLSAYRPSVTENPDAAPQGGYWTCSLQQRTVQIDAKCAALLGYPPAPLSFPLDDWKTRIHPEDGDPTVCRYQLIFEQPQLGDSFDDSYRIKTQNNDYIRVLVRGSVLQRDENGSAVLIMGSLQNTEVLQNPRDQRQQDNGSLLFAINAAGDGVWDWDARNDTVYYSPRYLSMLGYTAEQYPGTLDAWKIKIHPDDYAKIVTPQREVVESPRYGDTFECTYRLMCADGSYTWILGRGYVTHRDNNGRATRLVGLHTNISNSQGDREKLEELVKNDALTGLRSRTYCDLEMERIEKAHLRPLSVIFCDVNGLKLINDYLGHSVGDQVLIVAATLLRQSLRTSDCVARMGGDEFAILLPGCPARKAQSILLQLRSSFDDYAAQSEDVPVLVSLGVAGTDDPNTPVSRIFVEADRNMLRAKVLHRTESHTQIKQWIEKKKHTSVSLHDSRYYDDDPNL